MAYGVEFSLPIRELGKSDIEFSVYVDGSKLGTLKISKGSLVWFPANTTNGHKITWSKFDRLMRENAVQVEKR